MTIQPPSEAPTMRWARGVSAFLATLAFPVAWCACIAVTAWPEFQLEIQAARLNGTEVESYERWGMGLSQALYFAAGFWLVHAMVSYTMPRRRRASRDTQLIVSSVSGLAAFLAWKALVALSSRTPAPFWLLVAGVAAVAILATAFAPTVLRVTAPENGDAP